MHASPPPPLFPEAPCVTASGARTRCPLREQEGLLRLFLENTPAAVAMLDRELRYLAVSKRFSADFRLGAAELIGRRHYEVFPEIPERWREIHRRCLAGAVERCEEEPFFRADGTVDWLRWEVRPWRDDQGAIGGIILFSENVTGARRARDEVRRTELRYRLLADHLHDVIWTLDLATARFTYVSPSILALRGLTVEEALEEPIERSLTPESLARVHAAMARIGTSDEQVPITDVYDQPCKDGSVKHVEITTTLVRDAGGRPIEVVGVSRDATARVEAERALLAREGELQTILDASLDGLFILDMAGRILQVNDVTCAQTGYSRAELQGMSVADLEVLESPAEVAARVERIRARGWDRFEARHRRKDGSHLDIEASVQHAPAGGGRLIAFVRDITPRKAAERALREGEERYRALTERSSDLLLVLDEREVVTFVSPSSEQILGLPAAQLVGRPGRELVHPDDGAMAGANFATMLADPARTVPFDIRLRNGAGGWTLLEAQGRNLLDVPSVRGVVINHRDVTERNSLRDRFHQAQKLESVGRLAGGVAHDFNNLLTVILGCSEALLERLDAGAAESRDDVEQIRVAGERARDLTGQLLAFARKQFVTPAVIDLNAVLVRQQRMLGRLLGEDVDLEVRLQPLPWMTFADPSQVEQVLLNLAVNARDAMPRGGKLVIETRNRAPDAPGAASAGDAHAGEWVQLRVTDDGVGMSDEVRLHLFEPFFTTKDQGKGTGLGLATVYGVVTQAGGHLHVDSAPGRGTTVEVCLPRAEQALLPAAPVVEPATSRGTEQVLVVEDDPLVRGLVVRSLTAEGYRVQALGHPRQALALGAEALRAFRLLVSDVVLPGLDGHALAVELLRRAPGLRVLYVSGYTRDAIAERGVVDSGLQFLAKPFTRAALLAKVRQVLDAP